MLPTLCFSVFSFVLSISLFLCLVICSLYLSVFSFVLSLYLSVFRHSISPYRNLASVCLSVSPCLFVTLFTRMFFL
jgi:hypothetical protein